MLPFHLGLTVIAYYVAILSLDRFPSAKKYAHPILILTAEILLVCFISSLIYHRGNLSGFLDDLKYYKTGKNYLNLFNGKALYDNGKPVPGLSMGFTSQPMWPGCGDILTSLMDISIVSLSLPMFTHRHDFIKNFWLLMPPIFDIYMSNIFLLSIDLLPHRHQLRKITWVHWPPGDSCAWYTPYHLIGWFCVTYGGVHHSKWYLRGFDRRLVFQAIQDSLERLCY
ncbi:hypothetical protein HF325_005492 [Metschnikowia pulcherrima]|uniref:Uncharacterized protein n=1 Tax=Metschnikowia pulcherrima TaxID=27326 RepID=A0A8H7GRS7_9ASCO|nr:hypothetical protein HF325_005492 [Metschnikowia pulcherrima]